MTVTAPPPKPDSFKIPTIDIAPYIADPTSIAALKVIAQVRQACTTTGFFQIAGHGVPRSLQEQVFKASAAFFALPLEEKVKLNRGTNGGPNNRGYEVMGTQVLDKGQKKGDQKEGFYIAQDLPFSHPVAKAFPTFAGPNVFPSFSVLPSAAFKEPMIAYHEHVLSVTRTMFDILAAGLPYGPHVFDEFMSNDPLAVIRPLHYPPSPDADVGAGAHTDFGALTLLLQDSQSGLEVCDPKSGDWIPVPPNPDVYVVNIGDMLDKWTKRMYRSTLHRVINAGDKDRYSVPFFFVGNLDCKLIPFDGTDDGNSITVFEHMQERFASTYVQKK